MFYKTFDEIFTYENLYKSHLKARCSKRKKMPIVRFELNEIANVRKIYEDIRKGKYAVKGYNSFVIFEPKRREIQTLKYPDRVVQHAICDYALAPYFTSRAIMDNAVCQKGKGMHFALKRFEEMLREHIRVYGVNGYIYKGDISKYFATIPHEKLKSLVASHIADEKLTKFVWQIIDSYHTNAEYLNKYNFSILGTLSQTGRGLPIGNQTSQIFGMFYLDKLDRLIKEKLRIKIYSRYMDDFVLVVRNKTELKNVIFQIEALVKNLGLYLNPKSSIFPLKCGLKYLGYRYYIDDNGRIIKKVSKKTITRFKTRVKFLNKALRDGAIDIERFKQTLVAYHGHLKHGKCYRIEKKIQSMCVMKGANNGTRTAELY